MKYTTGKVLCLMGISFVLGMKYAIKNNNQTNVITVDYKEVR